MKRIFLGFLVLFLVLVSFGTSHALMYNATGSTTTVTAYAYPVTIDAIQVANNSSSIITLYVCDGSTSTVSKKVRYVVPMGDTLFVEYRQQWLSFDTSMKVYIDSYTTSDVGLTILYRKK